jgi:hypothetical protein
MGAVAASAIPTASSASAQGSAFQSGAWAGAAYGRPDGTFERCVITSDFAGKPTLGFGREVSGRFEIWLVNPAWTFEPGGTQIVTLSIDGSQPVTGNFVVIAPDRVATQVPPESGLVDGVKRGNVLKLTFGGQSYDFPLKGTFNAINALDTCARNKGIPPKPAAAPAPAPSGGQRAAAQASAEQALRKLASVSGDLLFKLSAGDFAARIVLADQNQFRIPEDLQKVRETTKSEMAWSIEGGFGLSKGVRGNPNEEDLRAELLMRREGSCAGQISSSADMRISAVKDRLIKRVEIGCTQDTKGNPAYEVFSFYPHESGNLIMIVHFASSPEGARQADEAFFRIVEAVAAAEG